MNEREKLRFVRHGMEKASAVLGLPHALPLIRKKQLATPTMIACLSLDEQGHPKAVYLKDGVDPVVSLWAVAHELRHARQALDGEIDLAKYQTPESAGSITAYNLQSVELDAHAFANRFMLDYYGIKMDIPTFKEANT